MPATPLDTLLADIRACQLCPDLPLGPRPVLQASATARILIAAQAPGRKVHASGRPFTDASGERLRDWLGMPPEVFYDARRVAIVPMGFCYPGTGAGGDLPPRPECAPQWRAQVLARLPRLELTLVIGQYALAWHLGGAGQTVTQAVQAWRSHWPGVVPLPHPSPRNNLWLRRNPWFEAELVPALRARVAEVLGGVGECY
ncbi:MAG: uracil-DNA glycosylase family protein [Rhodoferax sp.]